MRQTASVDRGGGGAGCGPRRCGQSRGRKNAGGGPRLPEVCTPHAGGITKIATANLIIEFNSTDNDLGVHRAFDDQGWSELCVMDPTGRPILVVDPRNQLNDHTMAGIFFESREPPASEFSKADPEKAFPEGMYKVRGRSFDGTSSPARRNSPTRCKHHRRSPHPRSLTNRSSRDPRFRARTSRSAGTGQQDRGR